MHVLVQISNLTIPALHPCSTTQWQCCQELVAYEKQRQGQVVHHLCQEPWGEERLDGQLQEREGVSQGRWGKKWADFIIIIIITKQFLGNKINQNLKRSLSLSEFHVSLKMKRSAVALTSSSEHLRRGRRKSSTTPVKGRGKSSHCVLLCTVASYVVLSHTCMYCGLLHNV